MAELPTVTPRPKKIDTTTIAGIGVTFAALIGVMALGGDPGQFADLKSFLIVIVGTIFIVVAGSPWSVFTDSIKKISLTFSYNSLPMNQIAEEMVLMSNYAKKEGVLKLEGEVVESLSSEPFLCNGLQLVIDSIKEKDLIKIFNDKMGFTQEQNLKSIETLERIGSTSPVMGLIGTIIGLVQMLANLDDPSAIGPGMAVALLTTLYGSIIANVLIAPLVSKLKIIDEDDITVKKIYSTTLLSIARKENPRMLEQSLNGILSAKDQINVFE